MIYLYDSHEKDFTYNGQPLPKSYDVVVRRFINDEYYVTWKHSIDKEEVYKSIQEDMIITAHTPDGMQPFRIMEPIKSMDYVEFEAWPLLYADMRNKLIRPISLRNATGQQAISAFLNNLLLDTQFVFTTNITSRHDYHTQTEDERETNPNQLYDALEVFKDIVNRWNGELIINGYDIRIVNRLGVDSQALLYEKKNITSYLDRETISNIVTRLHGKSEWVEDLDGGETRNHVIQTIVDSPLINTYNGIIFEKQYTNNDIRTEQEMKNWLNRMFTVDNIDKPSRSIELDTNIVEDEEIHLGDGLVLKYLKHDADMQIRMIGYEYDGYANRYVKTYLGDAKESFTRAISNTVTNLGNTVKQQSEQVTHVILNRQGVKLVYSSVKPTGNFRNDDIWFDDDGGMYRYDSELADWIPHPYNRRTDVVKQMVEDAQKQADADRAKAEADMNQALLNAQAYADAKAQEWDETFDREVAGINNSITTGYTNAVNEASRLVNESEAEGQQRMTDYESQVTGMNALISSTDTKAQEARTIATGAKSLADSHAITIGAIQTDISNNVKPQLSTAAKNAQDALNDLSTLATDVTKKAEKTYVDAEVAKRVAQTTYNSKMTLLDTAISGHSTRIENTETGLLATAKQTEVDALKTQLSEAETLIETNATQIALRATTTELNTATGRLSTAEAQLLVQAGLISSKVGQTDFNTLSGTVTTTKTLAEQTAAGLTTKASTTEVDTLKGTVTSQGTSIAQNATAITQRLTQTQVDTLVNGKGYSTKIYVDGQITSTATSFGQSLTMVEQKIPTEVGGRNLIPHTESMWERGTIFAHTGQNTPANTRIRTKGFISVERDEEYTINRFKMSNSEIIIYEYDENQNFLGTFGGTIWWSSYPQTRKLRSQTNFIRLAIRALDDSMIDVSYLGDVKFKLEKGTIPSDWSPAPEDMPTITEFNTVKSTVDQTVSQIGRVETDLGSTNTTLNTTVNTVNSMSQTLSQTTSNLGTLQTNYNSFTSNIGATVRSIADQSYISQQVQAAGIIQTEIGKIEIGGRNLLTDSEIFTLGGSDRPGTRMLGSSDGIPNITYVSGNLSAYQWIQNKLTDPEIVNLQGEQVVLSIDVKTDSNGFEFIFDARDATHNHRVASAPAIIKDTKGKWKRVSTVLTFPTDGATRTAFLAFFRSNTAIKSGDVIEYKNFKLERGNKATDWTPAPEDDKAYIDTAVRTVQTQLDNSWAIRTLNSAGSVLSQINVNSGGVKIEGRLIHLSGLSQIDAAVIKSAHIDTLNVGKLAGTTAEFNTLFARSISAGSVTATHVRFDNAFMDQFTANTAVMDRLFVRTAFTARLDTRTLSAITANITTIRSQVLIADAIKSTHLETSAAMVDKMFATTAMITQLTSKTAFISNIQAINISADRITTGTLNAANVTLINLNASSITTGTISGANSSWNLNTGVLRTNAPLNANISTELANGVLSLSSNAAGDVRSVVLDGQGLTYTTASKVGRIRFNGDNFVLDTSLGLFGSHINSVDWLRLVGNNSYEMTIHKHPTASGGAIVDSSMVTLGMGVRDSFQSIAQFYGQIDFRRNLHMLDNDIRAVKRIALNNSNTNFISHPSTATPGGAIVDSTRLTIGIGSVDTGFNDRITVTNSQIDLWAHTNLQGFRLDNVARIALTETNGWYMHLSTGTALVDTRMVTIAIGNITTVDRIANFFGTIHFFKSLNMNGNSITNNSDERLKKNIVDNEIDSLSAIKGWRLAGFDWIRDDDPKGRQFSVIAQSAPEIAFEDDGYLSVNSSKQLSMVTHGLQQLALNHDDTVDEIFKLKQRVQELEYKLKEIA